jgi:hypothetical protein
MTALLTLFKLVEGGLPPQRADRSVGGKLPTRGYRFCEPVTSASAFGWYVFLPVEFSVIFDGTEMLWTFEGARNQWFPLVSAQYPAFASAYDAAATEETRGYSPPFLASAGTPGNIQVWTGLVARTSQDWSLLVRPVANWPRSQGFEVMEGIIETDRWFGPLFTNVQIKQTDRPITFRTDAPFAQLQPVHRAHYDNEFLENFEVRSGLSALTPEDWTAFGRTIVEPLKSNRELGGYAVAARKRRAEEKKN